MASIKVWFMLGRQDHPTDALEDHGRWLGEALRARGHAVRSLRVPWDRLGWIRALQRLRRELARADGSWVLMQYTHLAWSRWGFPFGALVVARAVRRWGLRLGVVLHDPWGFPGRRLRDRARRRVQQWVMRKLIRLADRAFSTIHPDVLPWLNEQDRRRLHLLPVGSNILPMAVGSDGPDGRARQKPFTVVLFGVTDITEKHQTTEVDQIAQVVAPGASETGSIHLVVMGRGSSRAESLLQSAFDGMPVRLTVTGVIPPEEVSRWLGRADAFLFVRGGVSSRRGTVVAAIAHGVPVIGYRSVETAWPITEAGVALVEFGDVEGLARLLLRLARDPAWAAELRERNRVAYERYFSWEAIAERFLSVMGG